MRPAIFLDRDGVLNENCPNHVRSWADIQILPGIPEVLAKLAKTEYAIVVVTNQSVVSHGILTLDETIAINRRLMDELTHMGARIDLALICPHKAADGCECRKPKPGMLFEAAGQLGLDLEHSWMIGDALTDVQAGLAAGVSPILVLTGRGVAQREKLESAGLADIPIGENLAEAVRILLGE
ncbi:MAG TPA: HAD-IIIA family hydrolase [Anaerolineales bacterium]|nr:HAD-IIIA family hydrolase [Anaerolineales bacterium]